MRHGDNLFTGYSTGINGAISRRSLLSKDVSKAKMEVTSSLGLDHGSWKGVISQMEACGSYREDCQARADHSTKSSLPETKPILTK